MVDSPVSEARAAENAQQAISNHPNLACMVGLFAYHPAMCLQAVRDAGRLAGSAPAGKAIVIVGFDESQATLQGVIDGHIEGTVVQSPYEYGYRSVKILAALAKGDRSVLPENGWVHIPPKIIRQAEAKELLAEVNRILAKG
jgi:ribose transport system substrate-binding protein